MDVYSWFRHRLSAPRNSNTDSNGQSTNHEARRNEEEDESFGVTDQLIDFVKTFTFDTFINFHLQDEEGANGGDRNGGNVRKDLSDWQARHAMLVLSKVKEMSQLRFQLCPRHMKERRFWRIYFALVKTYVAKYELRAIRLEKLRQMKIENESNPDTSTFEVEMSETKQATSLGPSDSLEESI